MTVMVLLTVVGDADCQVREGYRATEVKTQLETVGLEGEPFYTLI